MRKWVQTPSDPAGATKRSLVYVAGCVSTVRPGDSAFATAFTGKERDGESGLDYFGARCFSGAHGRLTSPDPKIFPHNLTAPQNWNEYTYTRNNPMRYIDPDGEDWQRLT